MIECRSVVRLLQRLAVSLFVIFMVVMAYGIYYFPAAPIRAVDGQFIDKRGQTHSRQEFERLRTWERVYIGTWIAMFAATVASQLAKRRSRQR